MRWPGRPRHAAVCLLLIVSALALSAGRTHAQEAKAASPSPDKFSGLIYGDYYYFTSDHSATFDGQHGFWFRRIYFTYDHTFSSKISTRFRLEALSNGKMTGGALSITPYVKDAWLKWTYSGKHQVQLGILPTATLEFVQTVAAMRHIEKPPVGLYHIDSSRDFGVSFSGPIDAGNTVQYTAQFGSDSSNYSEIDKYKALRFALRYVTNPGWFAEGVYAFLARPLAANHTIAQLFVGYQSPKGRVGVQYVHDHKNSGRGNSTPNANVDVFSGFGVWAIKPGKVNLIGRVDHSGANADVGAVDYLPIYNGAPFTLGLAGLEYYVFPGVSLSPNVEWVRYGAPVAGVAAPLKNDLVYRLTWYWIW